MESKPAWKEFEELIAAIQKELAPNAEVQHDHRVRGKSGSTRKLDVTLSAVVGTHSVFIVFDCKDHKKRVDRGIVAKFAEQLRDVGADLGIMVSKSGFGVGARKVAAKENIRLQTYGEALETDWKRVVDPAAWLTVVRPHVENVESFVILGTHRSRYKVPFTTAVYNEAGEEQGGVSDVFWKGWDEAKRPRPIGDLEVHISEATPPLFIRIEGRPYQTHGFIVTATMVPQKFISSLYFQSAKMLRDVEGGKIDYVEIASDLFNIDEVLKTQPCSEVGKEEWGISEANSNLDMVESSHDDWYEVTLIGHGTTPS